MSAVCRVGCGDKRIALTFDDGPHPVYTPEILGILSEYGVKATFFVVGTNAELYPDIIIDEISCGHEIGNHTYSHEYLCDLTATEIKEQLERNEKTISDICDYKFKLLRPPGGIICDSLKSISESLSYKVVLWSVDTRDWTVPEPERIINNVKNNVKGGDVILMHDYVCGERSSTAVALRSVIPYLLDEGYEFVTVSELICAGSE